MIRNVSAKNFDYSFIGAPVRFSGGSEFEDFRPLMDWRPSVWDNRVVFLTIDGIFYECDANTMLDVDGEWTDD